MDLDNDELKMTKEHNLRLGKQKKVVLCGSLKETKVILRVYELLCRLNFKVEIPEEITNSTLTKLMATKIHLDKIIKPDVDGVLIVNSDTVNDTNYIGASTLVEIAQSVYYKKRVYLLYDIWEPYAEELNGWGVQCCKGNIDVFINAMSESMSSNSSLNIVEPFVNIQKYSGISIMHNIEEACRTCYRSEGNLTQDSYKTLLKNCITRGHESVLEHEKITIKMLCDVGVYKDLTRHRIASFSIESTRYCNYSKDKFNNKINFIRPVFYTDNWVHTNYEGSAMTEEELKSMYWYNCMEEIQDTYMKMSELGCIPDEMRMILPHSTAAYVTMTANITEWRHILKLRCNSHAHPAVQQIMIPVLLNFKYNMPELFEDIEYNTQFPKDKLAKVEQVVVEE